MANKTRHTAHQVHGTNPQFLIDKVTRSRIYDCLYWKDECFALTAASLVDTAALRLRAVGGTYAVQRPTEFLCLVLKMLQLQPERDIVIEYLEAREFKYLRALAAFYIRLTFPAPEIYPLLEPLLSDGRKLRYRNPDGSYRLTYIDAFADELLHSERVCDVVLPRLVKREVLERAGEGGREGLEPRVSALEEGLLASGSDAEEEDDGEDRERRRRWRDKIRRTREVRERREQRAPQSPRPRPVPDPDPDKGQDDDQDDDGAYASQELTSDDDDDDDDGRTRRYVSRSPSRSRSPNTDDGDDGDDDDAGPGYISRSPSRSVSPDRA